MTTYVVYRHKQDEEDYRREYLGLAGSFFFWIDPYDYNDRREAKKEAAYMTNMEAALFIATRSQDGYRYELEEL